MQSEAFVAEKLTNCSKWANRTLTRYNSTHGDLLETIIKEFIPQLYNMGFRMFLLDKIPKEYRGGVKDVMELFHMSEEQRLEKVETIIENVKTNMAAIQSFLDVLEADKVAAANDLKFLGAYATICFEEPLKAISK